jgi:glucosamine--fructose-6-phosphate aminotransferase (isomerizing)
MCGIVGYVGRRTAAPLLVEGLRKLEYRGYDSYGVATLHRTLAVLKKSGRIPMQGDLGKGMKGKIGIGHTRWATHGEPSDRNAHPHTDCTGRIAVVHNGIIENYAELRRELAGRGHRFLSETDTEVIAHLVEEEFRPGNLQEAVERAIRRLEGSYALLVIAEDEPGIVAARKGSPLVIGIGDGETLVASDMTPLLEYTERVIFLEDGDVATLNEGGAEICVGGAAVERPVELVTWCGDDVKKGGFAHFMLKEIHEQPQVFYETARSVDAREMAAQVRASPWVTLIGCGTSYHAGLVAKYLLEAHAGIPVRVEMGSEFKYFSPPIRGLVMGITQSGETADTLTALQKAKSHNCPTAAVTNVVGSSVTRLADHTLYTRAGPEIGVAATKSFTAQLAVFLQLASRLSDGALDGAIGTAHLAIGDALRTDLDAAVSLCTGAKDIFFVGRGPFYPVALEGALKMKEISYIHAEGYPAGELKHGPFALLTPETPVVAIALPGPTYAAMISNIKEMKARHAPVIGIGAAGDQGLAEVVDVFIPLPEGPEAVHLLTATVILQRLAYHTADALSRDIDRPRNLAKSVTVE